MNKLLLPAILLAALAGCSGRNPTPVAVAPCADSTACLRQGRDWLSGPAPDLPVAEARAAAIAGYRRRWDGDAFLALEGACITRLGGSRAASGDVIGAVEAVDSGLAILDEGRRRFPSSLDVRTTQILTLSRLPRVLGKADEARDSLAALAGDARLGARVRELVEQARESLGKE
jgi:hypothetical protein